MSEHIQYVRSRPTVTCDGCGWKVSGPTVDGYAYAASENLHRELMADGWQVWAGRNRRHYCPGCNPSKGHKMRLVAGELR